MRATGSGSAQDAPPTARPIERMCCPLPEKTLTITGGHVVDGTGAPAREADVLIRNGTIAEVGPSLRRPEGSEVVEAEGLVVAPGFIDCHTHYDRAITWEGIGRHCALQGITTVVGGNCGGGDADMAAHLDAAEAAGPGVSYTCLVGLSSVRTRVKGPVDAAPTSDELATMMRIVEEALDAGAVGVSWGPYGAAQFQGTEEVRALVAPAGRRGRVFATHRRNERGGAVAATREALAIVAGTDARLIISHLKVIGPNGFPLLDEMLETIDAARREGLPAWCDAYPYTGAATGLSTLLPEWAKEGGRTHAVLGDDTCRTRLLEEIQQGIADRCSAEDILCFARHMDGVFGLSLAQVAESLSVSPAEAVVALVLADPDARGGGAVYRNTMREDQVQRILSLPYCCVGADSGVTPEEGRPLRGGHPRSFGAFARALRWSREGRTVGLATVVRQCSGLPAEALGIHDRGTLVAGKVADVVVFDPKPISDRATYEEPVQYPAGIRDVLLAGEWMVRDGSYVGAGRGKVLRDW
ncbi:MAG: amidohydrolase family protein [Armatimonadia bacterium]|nr:amidohydrolase family protein [Armatimonadia bacterium]